MMPRGYLERIYTGAAIAGFVLPYCIIVPWFRSVDFNWLDLIRLPFANRPAAMFSADVLFSAAIFTVWADIEARRLSMQARWQPIAVIVLAGLCCSLPCFLARRERALAAIR